MRKEWLNIDEFKVNLNNLSKIIEKDLSKGLGKEQRSEDIIQKRLNINILNNYNHLLMNKYGEEIFENNVLIGYKFKENEGVLVKKKINKLEQEYNEVTVLELKDSVFIRNNVNELIKWTDTKIENGFIREIDQLKFILKMIWYIK